MRLVISEKNIAARRIAEILALGKPESDSVYGVPVYRFRRDGEDWVSIGLRGHIMQVEFPEALTYRDDRWYAVWQEWGEAPTEMPDSLSTPPWPKPVKKPFSADGVGLKQWKLTSLPYLVWAPVGKSTSEREIVRALKNLAKKADSAIIATDYDREGELIGFDARSVVLEAKPDLSAKRARFSAITKEEIEKAFSNLDEVSDDLAQAGGARQDIDLVWGAVLTRYLTKVRFAGVAKPRSAGRVQTPTLKIIVDREKERDAFVPETYWTVKGDFKSGKDEFVAAHKTERFGGEEEAKAVVEKTARETAGKVVDVVKRRRTLAPPAPFNTTSLLAAAAAEGLAPARTMRIAESLYIEGLISYPRVDNTVYPASLDLAGILRALDGVPAYHEHAAALLGKGKLSATRGNKETTDHPPIHPTAAADPERLRPEQFKLYNLVARRFMATLSDPAVLESTKATVEVAGESFVASGDVVITSGYRDVYPYGAKKEERLPSLSEGQDVDFLGARYEEKQTQPPKRYGEGGIIQQMEKLGLGTKATRHDIVQTLLDRRYLLLEEGSLVPTCLGRTVIDALESFAVRITTPGMTAELEEEMDAIANGRAKRKVVVNHSRELLEEVMGKLLPKAADVGELLKAAANEDARVGACPKSGHDLLVKPSKNGQFVGCAGWPDCDVTYPLPDGGIEPVEEPCSECGTPQVKIIQFRRKPIVRCLDPACKTNYVEPLDLGPCPVCAAEDRSDGRITLRVSQRTLKRFARCTNYETCGRSYPLPQNGDLEVTQETCEPCGSPIVVAHTRRGPWRVCIDPECPSRPNGKDSKGASGKKKGGRRASGSGSRRKRSG
ncbi:MAG: DNA topoisomerase I [Coriobacteriia bacterium]|nr:DNA topoisomerase I [Coriobacteriia bacterium]